MAKPSKGISTVRCPACAASVRSDRVGPHLSSVHPGFKPSKDFAEKMKEFKSAGGRHGRGQAQPSFFTKWRVVGIVALVLFASLVAYAFTRPGPASVSDGKQSPAFSFTDTNGNSHALSSYQGHPVLLWWIATWCPHCGQDTQVFSQNYYSQYHAAGIAILEIQLYNNLGESGPALTTFASTNGYTGQAGWVFGSGDSATTATYDPQAVTDVYYLLNSHGVILSQGTGAGGSFGSLLQQAQGQ